MGDANKAASFLTGGISDVAQGNPLGQGMGETWSDTIGQSNAGTLTSLTGIPTFSSTVGQEGGTLVNNIISPADDYFYHTSPMQVFGEGGEETTNKLAKLVGSLYLGGVGAGMAGGSSIGAASAWPSTLASGTMLGGAAADTALTSLAPLEMAAATEGALAPSAAATAEAMAPSVYSGMIPEAASYSSSPIISTGTSSMLASAAPEYAYSGTALGQTAVPAFEVGYGGLTNIPASVVGGESLIESSPSTVEPGTSLNRTPLIYDSPEFYAAGAELGMTPAETAGMGAGGTLGGETSGGILGTLGKYKVPLGLLAANLVSQTLGAKSQEQANTSAVENNRQWWQENAYPNSSAVSAKSSEAYSNLASQLVEAKRKLMEDAAKRGLKGGSLSGAYNKLNTSAQKSYAQLANDLIQYQNTPMFSPTGTNMTATTTAGSNIANTLSGLTGTLGGLYAYKNYNELFG